MMTHSYQKGLKSIAVFEGIKGIAVIIAGLGLLRYVHRDIEQVGEEIVEHLHLNPARHYPQIFLKALEGLSPDRIRWLALGAGVYALCRLIEAYGLWRDRVWAEWLAIFSCGIYLPLELYHLYLHVTSVKLVITTINLLMVVYLIWVRRNKSQVALNRGSARRT